MIQEGKAEVLRAKVVYTIKPVPGSPQGKLKVRIVACGNFSQEDPQMEGFASGTNAVSVRIGLALASQLDWHGISIDIRTAFLNVERAGVCGGGRMVVGAESPLRLQAIATLVVGLSR